MIITTESNNCNSSPAYRGIRQFNKLPWGDFLPKYVKNDLSLNEFKDKIKTLQKLASNIEVNENDKGITLSFGYTYGVVSHVIDIRSMMKFADELLYEVKRSGKNNSLGKRYDLDMVDETK